jgi:hypothetical protein
MDYNENDQPILLPLSDIIRTFREERITQPRPEPITPVDFNPIFDEQYGNIKDAIPGKHQHNPDDINPVPGGALNEMTQADPFHAMNIPGGAPTTILTKADIPFLHPIPIPGGDTRNFPTGENINENENQGDNGFTSSGRPCQNVGTYKDGPAITLCLPIDDESYELAYDAILSNVCFHPVSTISNQGHFNAYHPQQKIQQQFLEECYLLQDTWFSDPNCFTAFIDNIILDTWDTNEMYFDEIKDPHILEACATSSKLNEDNPSFDTATRGPF